LSPELGPWYWQVYVVDGGSVCWKKMELTARTRMEVSEKGKEELLLLRPAGQALT
jgi:hypothetical protein